MAFDASKFGAVPVATPTASAFDPSKFGATAVTATPTVTPPPTDTSTSVGSKIADIFKGFYGYGKDVLDTGANTIADTARKVMTDATQYTQGNTDLTTLKGAENLGSKSFDVAGDVGGGVAKLFGGLFNSAIIKPVANTVSDIPLVQDLATSKPVSGGLDQVEAGTKFLTDKWSQFETAHPDAARKVADAGNIGQFLTLFLGDNPEAQSAAKGTIDPVVEAAQKGKDFVAEQAKEVPTIVSDIHDAAKTGLENRYVSKTVDDWNRVGGDYVKTDKMLTREQAMIDNPNAPDSVKDTPTFLSEHGISPTSLIKDGKFDTAATAEKLTGESIKPFEDALTAQLKVVQQGKPPVPISDIRSTIISNIEKARGETPDAIEAMVKSANDKIDALGRKYPDGVPLDKLNIEKGNFWKKTKFDLLKPLEPQINYQIGSGMKSVIETAAGDANVSELNGVLGNYYKASKFLQGLDGKVPKLSVGQKIFQGVTKGALTGLGEKAFGISGGVGGFLLGKSVAQILESASNPLKSLILSNLKTANPEAYTAAIKWLGEKEAERLARPLLEAPGELGSDKNPIITPAPKAGTSFEKPADVINRTDSTPGKTIHEMMKDAHTRGDLEKFLNEPYIPHDQLPVIEAGPTPKSKSDLPTIK